MIEWIHNNQSNCVTVWQHGCTAVRMDVRGILGKVRDACSTCHTYWIEMSHLEAPPSVKQRKSCTKSSANLPLPPWKENSAAKKCAAHFVHSVSDSPVTQDNWNQKLWRFDKILYQYICTWSERCQQQTQPVFWQWPRCTSVVQIVRCQLQRSFSITHNVSGQVVHSEYEYLYILL